MPLSVDVELSRSQRPVFPDRCVGCGRTQPGATVRVGTGRLASLTGGNGRFSTDAPACPVCRSRIRRQRVLRSVVGGVFGLAGLAAAIAVLGSERFAGRRWVALAIVGIFLLPWLLWEVFSPRRFDVTVAEDTVCYEFRDAAYAREFAALNGKTLEAGGA
jgi:hypothetical protein